jgi:hypothetical protein
VGKYAPKFKMGFSIMCGVSALQFSAIFLVKFVSERYGTVKKSDDADVQAKTTVVDDVDKSLD